MTAEPKKSNFNAPLNGYRGFCALTVFLYHVANSGVIALEEQGRAASFALSSTRYGVELFFMISGFVISGSLMRHATLSAFLRDRFVRIYSAWAPAIVVVSVVCSSLGLKMFENVSAARAFGLFAANLLLLPPLVPVTLVIAASWSLTYEWVFYIAAAAGSVLLRRQSQTRWPLVVWGLSIALFIALFPRALFFLPGVWVFARAAWFERHRQWLRLPWLSLAIFFVAWRLTDADKAELTVTMFDWAYDGRLLAAMVAFVAATHTFASITVRATSSFAFLESQAFQFLGKISFSFYLWHALVVSAVKRAVAVLIVPHLPPQMSQTVSVVAVLVGALAVSIPVAWASWLMFENRLAKVMRGVISPAPRVSQELSRSRPV
ncbi:MAG: acyltransferase [Polyangiales bacterium]